jgi:hypothetical protein
MNRASPTDRSLFGALLSVGLLVSACSANTDLPRNTQTVGGMTIELGVMLWVRVCGWIASG